MRESTLRDGVADGLRRIAEEGLAPGEGGIHDLVIADVLPRGRESAYLDQHALGRVNAAEFGGAAPGTLLFAGSSLECDGGLIRRTRRVAYRPGRPFNEFIGPDGRSAVPRDAAGATAREEIEFALIP